MTTTSNSIVIGGGTGCLPTNDWFDYLKPQYTLTPYTITYPVYPSFPVHALCSSCKKSEEVNALWSLPAKWIQVHIEGKNHLYCSKGCVAKAMADGS
jgi:hypothetical protein